MPDKSSLQPGASTANKVDALAGSVVARKYRLEALLGIGATGAVYRASQSAGQDIAVKILDPELMASEVAQRFTRESELMLGIHHPNVVRTLAAGEDQALGVLYLAMPLLHGEDLDAVISRRGALDPVVAVRIALQAARGIGAAHRLGVVHRDIKPGNLFLDLQPDGRLLVRVCDFGIAKRVVGGDTALTATGSQLGTPDYISPEQLKDSKSVDQRADIWGLGATLYEMLCGQPPFAHHSGVFDIIAAILSEDVPWIQDRAPWVDPALANSVHRALRRRPRERFQSMDQLADALTPHSGGEGSLTRAGLVGVSPHVRGDLKPRSSAEAISEAEYHASSGSMRAADPVSGSHKVAVVPATPRASSHLADARQLRTHAPAAESQGHVSQSETPEPDTVIQGPRSAATGERRSANGSAQAKKQSDGWLLLLIVALVLGTAAVLWLRTRGLW